MGSGPGTCPKSDTALPVSLTRVIISPISTQVPSLGVYFEFQLRLTICVFKLRSDGGLHLDKACSDISPIPRYNRTTRHACRHRRSCREGGDPVRYGLR